TPRKVFADPTFGFFYRSQVYMPALEEDYDKHSFLAVVDLSDKQVYQFDTNATKELKARRRRVIQCMLTALDGIVATDGYKNLRSKAAPEFASMEIMSAPGVPKNSSSTDSGIWVMQWMAMGRRFMYAVLPILDEEKIRIKMAITLLTGRCNEESGALLAKSAAKKGKRERGITMPPLADCRFFRFIIPNMENQIRLPVAFSNVVRDNMSNPVEVITTNGQSWSISWVVDEEHPHQIVFAGGWRAFYEHYHLRIGDSMLLSGLLINYGSLPAIPAHGNYTVQFFAIIPVNDPDTLKLPLRFSREYGRSLPRPLTLTTPTGHRHRVGWNMQPNGRIVLHGGWDGVRARYGLRDQWLVLFRYHALQNTMYVMFFNGHTMEINYWAHAGPGTDSTCITDPSAPRSRHIADGFRTTNPFFVIPIMHRLANRFL
ncbi:hypothetical protein S83_001703, partial [Arachis hypogaea]